MIHEKAKTMLQEKKLRLTNTRLEMLSFFVDNPTGHSLTAILNRFSSVFDRVTIYRTINTFVDMGFLTKTLAASGSSYYIFHQYQSPVHPHLKCKHCDAIQCLPALPDNYITQLQSFEIQEIPMLFEGVCDECAKKGKV